MRSLYNFIIEPLDKKRYNNTKKVGDKDLILNTSLQDHLFVSRFGIVIETPIIGKTNIKVGDIVVVNHNVFRRFYDVRGKEKNSRSYFKEDRYFVFDEQIYMYKRENQDWRPLNGYCFVLPIQNNDKLSLSLETDTTGIVKYVSRDLEREGIKIDNVIGFTPISKYEFSINGIKLYRVKKSQMCLLYGDRGEDKANYRGRVQSR